VPLEDPRGLALSGASAAALDAYETALDAVLSFHGDPIGAADAALALDPTQVSAHLLKAHTFAFSLHPGLLPKARACLDAAAALGGSARERLHMTAASAWLDGNLEASRDAFTAILDDQPRDLLALMFAHQADFFAGAEAALLERPTAAVAAWSPDLPGYGYLLGMRGFGLEEAGSYGAAEATALAALEHNSRDAWAIHAQGHVLEMQGRDAEGIAWYAARKADWAEDCFFAIHNWWHWALYHVDRDEPEAALALYDEGLAPGRRSITLNLADAAALLWRLALAGHDTGARAAQLAAAFDAPARRPVHVFTDVHAMLAFALAERRERAIEHLAQLEGSATGADQHAMMLRRLGVPAARALLAFAEGRWAAAESGLAAVLPHASLLTGSRAQRDILAMTWIEAAIRAGETAAARSALERRRAVKPGSRRVARDLARCR
jgi:hypothetical protein